jgi:hypothetical protein
MLSLGASRLFLGDNFKPLKGAFIPVHLMLVFAVLLVVHVTGTLQLRAVHGLRPAAYLAKLIL